MAHEIQTGAMLLVDDNADIRELGKYRRACWASWSHLFILAGFDCIVSHSGRGPIVTLASSSSETRHIHDRRVGQREPAPASLVSFRILAPSSYQRAIEHGYCGTSRRSDLEVYEFTAVVWFVAVG
jgi:hypothetical protein